MLVFLSEIDDIVGVGKLPFVPFRIGFGRLYLVLYRLYLILYRLYLVQGFRIGP